MVNKHENYLYRYVVCIYVLAAAVILEPSERMISIEEENNITLRCVGAGYPPPLVQWSKVNGSLSDRTSTTNMSMLTNEGNVTNVTVDLIFTGTYRDDSGVYECSISNILNTITRNTTLVVQCMLLNVMCKSTLYSISMVKVMVTNRLLHICIFLCHNI